MKTLNNLLDQYKLPIALSLIGLVLIIAGSLNSHSSTSAKVSSSTAAPIVKPNSASISSQLTLDISGAIKAPGVYTIDNGSRVVDIVNKAGGFLDNASKSYISKYINLSQKLIDGQKIYIPFVGDSAASATLGESANQPISVNNGTLDQLISLPGVGQVTAQKIIDNRPYSDIQDLLNNKVVNKGVFEKIKDLVTL